MDEFSYLLLHEKGASLWSKVLPYLFWCDVMNCCMVF